MPRGGARPNSGPKKGAKYRKVKSELDKVREAMVPALRGGPVTSDTFDAFEHMCQIAVMTINQAREQYKLRETDKDRFDPDFYAACLRDAMDAASEVVKYQRPTFKATLWRGHLPGMPLPAPPDEPRTIGGNVVEFPTDHAAAARAYQRLMASDG